jgi:hypothetical protein
MRYLFVGEKRSLTAIRKGWTWESGHLAARTLFDALIPLGITPAECQFMNAFTDNGDVSGTLDTLAQPAAAQGTIVVGMGKLAQDALRLAGIPHRALIHPAARGRIRGKDRYRAHVKAILTEETTNG